MNTTTSTLSNAQRAALAIIDANPSGSFVGNLNCVSTNTVHSGTAASLVARGIAEYVLGADGQFVKRVVQQPTRVPVAVVRREPTNTSTRTLRVADLDALDGDHELYVLRDRLSEFAGPRVYFYSDKAPRVVSRNGEHYRISCAESHVAYGETEPRLWVFLIGTNKRTGADYKSGKGIWVTFGPDSRKPQHWLGESFDVVERFLLDAGLLIDDSAPVLDAAVAAENEQLAVALAKRLDEYVGDDAKPLPVRGGKRNVKRSRKSGDPRADRAATIADLPFVVYAGRDGDQWLDSRWPTREKAEARCGELARGSRPVRTRIVDTSTKPCSACGATRGSGCAVCRPDSVLGG